jgi:hypothetical protein
MPTKTIRKHTHRAWPPSIGLFYKKEHISKSVYFEDSCRYELKDEDQYDTNKLFGIGYFWSHHKDSARFGWRYNHITDKIVISAYCYVDGEVIFLDLCEVKIGEWYSMTIVIRDYDYQFLVYANGMQIEHDEIKKKHKKKFGFPLGVYFGGQKTAPHNIKIKMQNL